MITAEALSTLTQYSAAGLTREIQRAGYKDDRFTASRFLGITNGGQFCYAVTYKEDGDLVNTKVFLTYNPATGQVIADY